MRSAIVSHFNSQHCQRLPEFSGINLKLTHHFFTEVLDYGIAVLNFSNQLKIFSGLLGTFAGIVLPFANETDKPKSR